MHDESLTSREGRLTRRRFLDLVGRLGGSAAVYRAALAIGLLPAVARGRLTELEPLGADDRRSVVILGAGIGGLTAAYELDRAGYDCIVLEASHRAGGRNLTLRAGDRIDELGNPQVCEFDDEPHLYMNAGPARIPANHHRLLHYARELGVQLEVFVNENRSAWVHDESAFGGRPVRNRRYVTDARGFMTEIMAKCVAASDLDKTMDGVDGERLLEFLRAYGDLDPDGAYRGSERAGHAAGGMVVPAIGHGVFDFAEILKAGFWRGPMHQGEQEDQAAPMMQPVGGMDMIVRGFMAKVGRRVVSNAQVRAVSLRENAVEIVYAHDGTLKRLAADYCLNSIPSHILAGLDHNFPPDYAAALDALPRGRLFKIGLQASRRFWEDEGIYAGISWTSQDITQIWYPGHGIFAKKGILLGAYTFGDDGGTKFARMSPAERIETAIRQGAKIHPSYPKYIENGVSVPWHRMNHMLGCAARWTDELRARYFRTLQEPAGRHYLIGDQVSYHPGWQEGAIASAHHALEHLNRRVRVETNPVLSRA
ncbi:MAG: flavin monoamine oxidase family protein [Gammaproteobacteria bacterium]|nr:flavin monoamine oxidase family protein [Gammaproteobacteria bacterium]